MNLSRRVMLAAIGSLATPAAAFAADSLRLDGFMEPDGETARMTRIFAGPDGKSRFEIAEIKGSTFPGTQLMQFINRKASAVAIYEAPAHHAIAAAQAKGDLLYILRGGTEFETDSGKTAAVAGTLVLLEAGARAGELAGRHGYRAVKVRLA